jgi:hypothetical protein
VNLLHCYINICDTMHDDIPHIEHPRLESLALEIGPTGSTAHRGIIFHQPDTSIPLFCPRSSDSMSQRGSLETILSLA